MKTPVGIDAAAFAGPHAYLELADLAHARGVDPDKFLLGLGQRRMAIASPCEDTVTLAVDAGRQALANYYEDIPAPPRPASLRSYREIASLARHAVAEPAGSL